MAAKNTKTSKNLIFAPLVLFTAILLYRLKSVRLSR